MDNSDYYEPFLSMLLGENAEGEAEASGGDEEGGSAGSQAGGKGS